jgi:hypothetical protein
MSSSLTVEEDEEEEDDDDDEEELTSSEESVELMSAELKIPWSDGLLLEVSVSPSSSESAKLLRGVFFR